MCGRSSTIDNYGTTTATLKVRNINGLSLPITFLDQKVNHKEGAARTVRAPCIFF